MFRLMEHSVSEGPRIAAYTEIPPAWIVQELWGLGLTVIPRVPAEKVFDLANGLAPAGMAYQWEDGPRVGWKFVPASRHPGLFMPYGHVGDIEVNGLWLSERPKAEVDAFHDETRRKARQNVADWYDRAGAQGFTGGVTVLTDGSGGRSSDIREIGLKTIEDATKIPMELMPYVSKIFAERDRLWADAGEWWGKLTPENLCYAKLSGLHPEWTRGQLMNAVLTPIAIENIRKRLEGTEHDQSTNSESAGSGAADTPSSGPSAETPPD